MNSLLQQILNLEQDEQMIMTQKPWITRRENEL